MGNNSPNLPAARPATDNNLGRYSTTTVETPPALDTPQNATTYNSPTETRSERIEKPAEDFRSTLRDKAGTKQADQPQQSESTDQGRPATADAAAESTQPAQTPQKPTPDASDTGENTVRALVSSKNRGKLATLLGGSQIPRSLGMPAQASEAAKVKTIMTNDQAQGIAKGISMELPRAVLVEKDHPGQGQANQEVQTAGKTVVSTKGLTISQDPKALAATASDFGRERAALNEPTIASALETADSNRSKALPQAAAAPDKVAASAEKIGKFGNLDNAATQKTEAMGDNLQKVEDADIEMRHKPASGADKSALNSHKRNLTANTANQQNSATAQLLGKGNNHADNAAGDSSAGNPNRSQVQIPGSSAGQGNNSDTGGSGTDASGINQVISGSGMQASGADRFAEISAQTTRNTGDASPDKISAGIGDQIQESIKTSFSRDAGDQQITIRLNPPELGKVFIKFHEQQDQITGLLEVSKAQTRYQIEQALPQILKNLQDSGIAVKRLEVSLTDQSEQQAYKDQSLQDGWSGQNHFQGDSDDNSDAGAANEWLTNPGMYTSTEPYEMLVTDKSINVLV